MKTKICNKCKRELPLTIEYFYARKDSKDGFRDECKQCRLSQANQYSKTHKEIIAEKGKVYRESNKEAVKKCKDKYYQENKEAISEKSKKYRLEHKVVKIKVIKSPKPIDKKAKAEYLKQYQKENKEVLTEYIKLYYLKHKEAIAENVKKHKHENRELYNILSQKREAKIRNLAHTLTLSQWDTIKQYFNNCCAYCGKEGSLHQEHFLALSKGGEYTHNNIVPACVHCNSGKSGRDFFVWYPKQKYYSKAREQKILNFLHYENGTQQLILNI